MKNNIRTYAQYVVAAILAIALIASATIMLLLLVRRAVQGEAPELHAAVMAHDISRIEKLLASGAGTNTRQAFRDWTPLHVAADIGDAEAAAVLIRSGAKLEAQDPDGYTPLHVACDQPNGRAQPKVTETGRVAVAQVLLKAGANPNVKSASGRTPLHGAVNSQSIRLVRLLLSAGASPLAEDNHGLSPLKWARSEWIQSRSPEIAEELSKSAERLEAK
jgi:ankyrin repeat protein